MHWHLIDKSGALIDHRFSGPSTKYGEFLSHQGYFPGPSPGHGWCAHISSEFFYFLHGYCLSRKMGAIQLLNAESIVPSVLDHPYLGP